MSVALTENVEHYLISLPYPKDISDSIAAHVLRMVTRRPSSSGAFHFELYSTSATDEQDYEIRVSVAYDSFGEDRLVVHLKAMSV